MPLPNQDATQIVTNNGLRTQYGVLIPPGSKVAAFVRSTGAGDDGADAFLIQNLVLTLASGLARCRPGKGDFVVVLPGHVENVADATTFSAALPSGGGVNIIGVGHGSLQPTFTWTAVASQWLVNQPNVTITGLRLLLDGINGVATAISVTGAEFGFYNNDVEVSTTARACTSPLQLTTGSTRFDVTGNNFRGLASVPTSVIITVAGAVDGGRICDNEILAPAGVTNGCINVTVAATNLKILRNTLNNTTAASVAAIVYANIGITGQCSYNNITVLNNTTITPGTTGITVGGTNNLTGFFQNFVVNSANASGLLAPAVDT